MPANSNLRAKCTMLKSVFPCNAGPDERLVAGNAERKSLRTFVGDRGGNIAIIFIFMIGVLMLFAGGAIDFTRYNAVRADMIESMDAAGLAMAQIDALNGPEIRDLSGPEREEYLKEQGRRFFEENFKHAALVEDLAVDFELTSSTITPNATGRIRTLLLGLGQRLLYGSGGGEGSLSYLDLSTVTEIVRRDDGNIELAMVMDITGSMDCPTGCGRIDDLKTAAKEMVDIVVREDQSEWYSKAALVPYSMGVNAGDHADDVRGPTPPPIAITQIQELSGNRVEITAPGHGFSEGDRVHLTGLDWPSGSGWVSDLDGRTYGIHTVAVDTFQLSGANANGGGTYTNGGMVWCVEEGCEYFAFSSATNSDRTFRITTCVSERVDAEEYTDAAPSAAPVGRVYKDSSNTCPEAEIMPLSTDKQALKDAIENFEAAGSTAGQIGIAWGWYLLSPNFGSLWADAESVPGAYNDPEVTKVVVIMTDDEFNTPYCKGVIARDAGSGSGGASDHINCNATNGDPYEQAEDVCDAMKDAGVFVYTIGFDISSSTEVTDLLTDCASGSEYVYFAATGSELKDIYRQIGSEITKLHIGK